MPTLPYSAGLQRSSGKDWKDKAQPGWDLNYEKETYNRTRVCLGHGLKGTTWQGVTMVKLLPEQDIPGKSFTFRFLFLGTVEFHPIPPPPLENPW